jgi:hypothetical protein
MCCAGSERRWMELESCPQNMTRTASSSCRCQYHAQVGMHGAPSPCHAEVRQDPAMQSLQQPSAHCNDAVRQRKAAESFIAARCQTRCGSASPACRTIPSATAFHVLGIPKASLRQRSHRFHRPARAEAPPNSQTQSIQKRFTSVPAKPAVSAEKRENPATASRNAPRQCRDELASVTERLWRIPADASIRGARQREGPAVHITAFDASRIFRPVLPSCRAGPRPPPLTSPVSRAQPETLLVSDELSSRQAGKAPNPPCFFHAKCGRAAYRPGRARASRPLSPLRTVRESFPSYGSSIYKA